MEDKKDSVKDLENNTITINMLDKLNLSAEYASNSTITNKSKNTIKRKFIPKETNDIIRGIDNNHNEVINQYLVVDDLGEGSYSSVKLFFDNNKQVRYAAKILNKKDLEKRKKGIRRSNDGSIIVDTCLKDALREIAILKRIDCNNIIQLREIIHDNNNYRIYLIMDYAEKGPILDFDDSTNKFKINSKFSKDKNKTRYTEDEIRDFLRGIVTVHQQNIVHRDIKPDNILLDSNNSPKITDFNVSALIDQRKTSKVQKVEGTMYFYAPEMCKEDADTEFEAFPLDVWALGITTYCLVYLKLPFNYNNYVDFIEKISNDDVNFPDSVNISEGLKDLIKQMLEKNPLKRITCKEIKRNKWLNQGKEDLELNVDVIKVSNEEIEKSLDFFISCAKARNNGLMWKQRSNLLKNSNCNLVNFNYNKNKQSKYSANSLKNEEISNININKENNNNDNYKNNVSKADVSDFISTNAYENYFKNSDNKINNKHCHVKRMISEDEFFDN